MFQVIVRDIVSKVVIAQFRAHKSPISALCFDPSGTLLVTASVQGHNINVFKIMPGLLGGSSACDAGAIASSFYNCRGNNEIYAGGNSSKTKNHLLVFSPSGCMYDTIWITNISLSGSNNGCVWNRHWL
ncbi:hypothetical protein Q3G72_017624 [Acer saccharum]|nr:hypothetical protein Q3G72_017624 [Acer saccharum]